ncbi:hypothetical protein FRACYDRAFT_258327 [Fragilariopsis cylindrus CCMP1102]|uniref:Uncharacterized protein n=1 Tax=Fragilariopsis cylindrus CCMP1102 TaxID=635003 RepID=A0A1E7EIQ5_9STRA|nr:hypothetical protein FRACYDRAFT_258327 [Fragilariopsis cylindrus CCMP1102]|eukprot:OEU05774.1 hypothetical protein FRACYDRAFT_258327 [Fragilariopsis cylindrus CCMP1102]
MNERNTNDNNNNNWSCLLTLLSGILACIFHIWTIIMTVLYCSNNTNNYSYNTDGGGAAVAEAEAAEDDNENTTTTTTTNNNSISTTTMTNVANETFLQKIIVGNTRMFNIDQILTFEFLMESRTIRSHCTVINQYIDYDDDPPTTTMNTTTTGSGSTTTTTTATATNVTDTDTDTVIVLHYIIAHESSICDVTTYPILSQN